MDNGGQCSRSCTLFPAVITDVPPGGRPDHAGLGVLGRCSLSLPEKHFPRVWQLEKNKRLLLAGRCNASHNTQLTAYSPMIHSQDWECLRSQGKKKNKCVVLPSFAIKFALFSPADTSVHFPFSFQNKLSEH